MERPKPAFETHNVIVPQNIGVVWAHPSSIGGNRVAYVMIRCTQQDGASFDIALEPRISRQIAAGIMEMAAIANHEGIVDKLRDVYEQLGVAVALANAKEYDNLAAVLARAQERAEPPAPPATNMPPPPEGV